MFRLKRRKIMPEDQREPVVLCSEVVAARSYEPTAAIAFVSGRNAEPGAAQVADQTITRITLDEVEMVKDHQQSNVAQDIRRCRHQNRELRSLAVELRKVYVRNVVCKKKRGHGHGTSHFATRRPGFGDGMPPVSAAMVKHNFTVAVCQGELMRSDVACSIERRVDLQVIERLPAGFDCMNAPLWRLGGSEKRKRADVRAYVQDDIVFLRSVLGHSGKEEVVVEAAAEDPFVGRAFPISDREPTELADGELIVRFAWMEGQAGVLEALSEALSEALDKTHPSYQ